MATRRAALLTGLAALAAAPAMARVQIEKDPWPTGEMRRAFNLKPLRSGDEAIRAFWLDGSRARAVWLVEARYDPARGPLLRFGQAVAREAYVGDNFVRLSDRTVSMKVTDYKAVRDSCFGLIQEWLKTPAGFESPTGGICIDWCGEGVEIAGVPGQAPLAITFDGAAEIIGARMRLAAKPYQT